MYKTASSTLVVCHSNYGHFLFYRIVCDQEKTNELTVRNTKKPVKFIICKLTCQSSPCEGGEGRVANLVPRVSGESDPGNETGRWLYKCLNSVR